MIVVCGAGGFIGGHLVRALLKQGDRPVRAVDIKPLDEWYQVSSEADNLQLDLSEKTACERALYGASEVYNLAADMGGMGFIENNKALCMLTVLINTHLLMAAQKFGVKRFFFSSSACIYPAYRQTTPDVVALKESDAYPAMPEDGYGWEKLFSERMCRHYTEDFGLISRIARYHNVYGPHGTYDGGREKAPAAICRKVIQAKLAGTHEIEIWGDGNQTRSFMYIDDCVKGTLDIMASAIAEPLNLGSSQLVTINQLVDIVEDIAQIKLKRRYNLAAPKGVNGRNSDNTLIQELLGWQPHIQLEAGMEKTFRWIYDQMAKKQVLVSTV
ncbi:NAD-dependent epimerase/dehydratase family protein [Phormidium sp. CLA17]|uniref:NAD-dependent epimerase/dehydratase family protein n=1 Tax=Leptolyngbya sp. Cla-17 TaxID=2803751 RepID=UPI001492AB0F|nr:NAD-dependent epimerase/dehydratase family protein [Leptolyngbya sp. Cla-17]MBM0740843.1 NAD-dependent epimerase/dehydratase family protein [Leptolyngbya sp. Cla-17]